MKPITLEDFYNDPDFYGRVERAAQRERALAAAAAFAWLGRQIANRLTPRPRLSKSRPSCGGSTWSSAASGSCSPCSCFRSTREPSARSRS